MNHRIFFYCILFFCFCFRIGNSQTTGLEGTILSKTDSVSLIGVGVSLLHSPDSTFYKGVATDVNGKFIFTDILSGNYFLKISYLGFKDLYRKVSIQNNNTDLGIIYLSEKKFNLGEVDIVARASQATLKGDTTEFNAAAFKTNPDATAEDLVQKMPGITSQNGTVQAQGENVQQVLVDGKPFLGDDANAALKNLPADVIDKIQVYDKQSDQSQFTGFDDGNSTKTINIITKPTMRNGIFGKIFGGYGTDDLYKSGGNINIFNGNRRISILGLSNNINQQNFSSEDLLGVSSGSGSQGGRGAGLLQRGGQGGGRGGQGGGGQNNSANNFLVNQSNGIATTNSFGFNYSDKWFKKIDVTGSYFFNQSNTNTDQVLFRNYVLPSDSGLTYNENSNSDVVNTNHRFNLRMEYQIDSANSIIFQPKLSLQENNGNSNLSGFNRVAGNITGATQNTTSSDLSGINLSDNLLFRHKFHKRGRTFSVNINNGYSNSKGKSYLFSENNFYTDTLSSDTLNQFTHLLKNSYSIGTTINYTEPITKKSLLQFNLGTTNSQSKNDKNTYDYALVSSDYSKQDSALSNTFKNTNQSRTAGLSYRMQDSIFQFTVGANYQFSNLYSDEQFPSLSTISKNYTSILPNAMFRFNFAKKKNLNINYRTSTNPPTADQLQTVVNNTNPLQLTTGNPDLKQNYQHNLFIRYSAVNALKSITFFALLSGVYADNYITNSTYIAQGKTIIYNIPLAEGTQLTRPVNLNGYYNVRSFVVYGFPVNFKKFNFVLNLNLSASYTNTPGLINTKLNYAQTPTGSAGLTISSNISEKVDFLISTVSSYNYSHNTLESNLNSKYFNQNSTVKLNWIFWKGFVAQTDLSYQYNTGLSGNYNQNYYLWNAALGYKFLKKQQADIRFSVADILKQNTNIQHNTSDSYIEDVKTNALQRYYMLTFTYTLKYSKKSTSGTGNHDK